MQEVASLKVCTGMDEKVVGGCRRCADLQRRVSQLTAELAALKAGDQGVVAPIAPQRPVRVDKWRPTDNTPLLREYFSCRQLPWERENGKCKITIVRADVVQADETFKFHYVSADMKRSKGVALDFAGVFGPVLPTRPGGFAVGDVVPQEKDGCVLLNLASRPWTRPYPPVASR